ncbi:hypothetical protein JH06_5416 [Blastocystis sp. subtype 4]|uniref:hypothetical protein n=1 Tax=Blastocystis sp. subtype 4 TaxID=944170 RepID=UPI0007120B6C|nr:hypothetical protein JH06_5416 [Blastocystis sp. subtype 4]KNB41304.1 hypothetical protein JH06_5416 [Blastocystis sp. subtype 4]|eukprot:XP_014524747.1 hypothetical protein JH06_5416 [Blastocystis sp. subtype 4]
MNARYTQSRYIFVMDTQVTTSVPSVRNIVDRWYIDTGVVLPNGLSLNAQTGEISGTPTYTVYAENESGATQATVSIEVRKGQCMAEGVFPVTYVGETAVQGSYVGTQKRGCILGSENGEWQNASGFCMSVPLLVMVVLIVIIIIAVIVKKAKAKGGVKGKKSVKASKTASKPTASMKKVKV